MSFYQDMVEGLKSMIGPGKKYSNPTQMARACEVAPNQIIRYIRQERGKHIQVIARVLDEVGAKIIFPGSAETSCSNFKQIQSSLSRPDSSGKKLDTLDTSISPLLFRENWLAAKGNADSMRILAVTGNAMSPRIEDGDFVVVDQSQSELYEGKIYALRIDREVIIRRIAKEPGKIILVSDNADAGPQRIDLNITHESSEWSTIGRVIFVAKDLP